MTAVNISGTFAKDERPYNGLEAIAEQLVDDEFGTHYTISRIKPHGYNKKPGEAVVPVAKHEHIEVVTGDDAEWVAKKLDERYRARSEREAGPATPLPSPGQVDGQMAIDGDGEDDGPVSSKQPDVWLDDK
ncbi:hypothetical protein [Phytohabitans rumicis]|uniref:Uncharacterized protein n=1 Tax=Phytohabitans rumicis TaxID=1076125 RepID=A0A6V8LBV6_9ACTN|nr:hypothetical protein [Phytohabitans rumicis]GFJ91566.1 hypothetical protein Prum_052080 [Phytohabitans rumicis]